MVSRSPVHQKFSRPSMRRRSKPLTANKEIHLTTILCLVPMFRAWNPNHHPKTQMIRWYNAESSCLFVDWADPSEGELDEETVTHGKEPAPKRDEHGQKVTVSDLNVDFLSRCKTMSNQLQPPGTTRWAIRTSHTITHISVNRRMGNVILLNSNLCC